MWTGKAPRTGLNPVRNVASKNIFKPNLCPPTPQPGGLLPPMAAGGFSRAPAQGAREKPFSPTSSINGKKERPMKKHTICLEARPFAAFSDEQLDRLTALSAGIDRLGREQGVAFRCGDFLDGDGGVQR